MINKNGSILIYSLMLALVIIVLALALSSPVVNLTNEARNSTEMDCDNASISDYNKAACVATDLTSFYFIASLIFISGTIIGAKIIFG